MRDGESWKRPLTDEELVASGAAGGNAGPRWTAKDVRRLWDEAETERGDLARLYCAERGLDLELIGPDEMRTATHHATPNATGYPALLFPGTDADGEVQRLQAVRFQPDPLRRNPPKAERLGGDRKKRTSGKGTAPFRCAALPDCQDGRLLLCEGPEDALTLRQVTGCEAWAALGLSALGGMPVPAGRTVVLCADRGSEDAAREAAGRLADRGADAWLAPPPEDFKDANDALKANRADLILAALETAEPVGSAYTTLPAGFRIVASGWIVADAEEGPPTRVCRGLKVLAQARDAAGMGWGVLAEIATPDRQVHRAVIPHEMLAGRDATELIRELRRLGLETYRSGEKRVLELVDRWRPATRARTVQRLGWVDETCRAFVLGDGRVIGENPAEPVILNQLKGSDLAVAMGPQNDPAAWQSEVAALAVGNPIMGLAIGTALAGPLLQRMGMEGGGLHLVGTSSRGKSTALRVAASVWGSPELVTTWRATANGLEGRAAAASGSVLLLDELGEVEPREAAAAGYMLANGAGKQRATQIGAAREVLRWRVLFLSSGEVTLADKVAEDRGRRVRAGQQVRLIDVPATDRAHGAFDTLHGASDAAAFADQLTRAAATSYGHAGPIFVARLVSDLEAAAAEARRLIDGFKAEVLAAHPDADGQVRRAASRFGLIAAAGELAAAWSILPWPEGVALGAGREGFRLWLGQRGGADAAERTEAIRMVRSFIAAHGSSRFERLILEVKSDQAGSWRPVPDGAPVRNRAGWHKPPRAGEPGVYYVSSDCWRDEVTAGTDPRRAARYLRDAGLLVTRSDRGLQADLPRGLEDKRAYAVLDTILAADDVGNVPEPSDAN